MISFSREVKEEIVFNDFDLCCSKAILAALIKINGTLSLSHAGMMIDIRTENAKIASKIHKILKEVLDYYEFLKWRNQRELERKTIECNEYNDDPEIEIEWFL